MEILALVITQVADTPVVWKLFALPTVSFLLSREKQPVGMSKRTASFKNLKVKTSTARVKGF